MKQATKNMMDAWTVTVIDIIFLELILAITTDTLLGNVAKLRNGNPVLVEKGSIWCFYYILIWIDPFCRMAIKNYCRLPASYMLPSYILLIGFIPANLLDNNLFFTVIGALISVLSIIFLPLFNIYYLIRAKRESAFEPVLPDNAQQ